MVRLFESQGQYQLYINDMEPDGVGALYLAYEQLKGKLENEGLFDQKTKRLLPKYPKHIGIITSPTGAAVRDILSTLERRYPIAQATVLPVYVQGENSKKSIIEALRFANDRRIFDVLILARGGGSIEELWSFNEEAVARAIFESEVPIISAVGHETDFTISDFVADFRAATPTGAAEIVAPSILDLQTTVKQHDRLLHSIMKTKITNLSINLNTLEKSNFFRKPRYLIEQKNQELDRLMENLTRSISQNYQYKNDNYTFVQKRFKQLSPNKFIQQLNQKVIMARKQLDKNQQQIMVRKRNDFQNSLSKLNLLNPTVIMERGYSIAYTKNDQIVRSVKQLQPKENLTLKVLDGEINCVVNKIEEGSSGDKRK